MTDSEGGGASASSPAARYERLYPETGCSEAQKEERMQRIDFKQEAHEGRRTTRNRGIVIPGGAWERIFGQETST